MIMMPSSGFLQSARATRSCRRRLLHLRRHPRGRVRCSVSIVPAGALLDLEKEAVGEALAVRMKIFARRRSIVEDAEPAHPLDDVSIDVQPRYQIVIVVRRDGHEFDAGRAELFDRSKDVAR